MSTFIEKIIGDFGEKRRWREYKVRVKSLPEPYRTAIEAVERYLTYFGAISKGDVLVTMVHDLADLFEQSAADGLSIRSIIGDDPVEFSEEFLKNYADGQWINKERERLVNAITSLGEIGTGHDNHRT